MSTKSRRLLSLLVRGAIVAGLLGALLAWIDVDTLVSTLLKTPLWLLAVGLALGIARLWLMSVRWWLLERTDRRLRASTPAPEDDSTILDGVPLTIGMCLRYRWAATVAGLFAPTVIGTDIGRIALVSAEHRSQRLERGVIIIFDRIVGLVSVIILGLLAAAASPEMAQRGPYVLIVAALLAGLLATLVGTQTPYVRRLLARADSRGRLMSMVVTVLRAWVTCWDRFHGRYLVLASALGLSFLVHGASMLLLYVAALAYGADVSFLTLAAVTAVSWLVNMIPIGFGGLGLRELSFALQLSLQGVDPAIATGISLFQFAIELVITLLGVPLLALVREREGGSDTDE